MATANKKDTDPNTTMSSTNPNAWYVTWDEDGEPGSGLPTNLWATLLDINWTIWTYPSGDNKGKYLLALETLWLADDRTIGVNHDGVFPDQESAGKLMNHLPSYDGVTPAELTGFKDMDQLRAFVGLLGNGAQTRNSDGSVSYAPATNQDGSPLLPEGTEIKAGQLVYIGEKVPTEKKHILPNPDTKAAQQKRSFITTLKDNQIALPSDARDIHYFRGIRAYLVRMPHVTSMGLPGYGSKNRKDGRESEVLCVTQIDPQSVANLGKHMSAALTPDGGSKPNGATAGAAVGGAAGVAGNAGAGASTGASTGINADVQQFADKFAEIAIATISDENGTGSADFATVRSAVSKGLKGGEMAKAIGTVNKLRSNAQWWADNGLKLESDSISLAE